MLIWQQAGNGGLRSLEQTFLKFAAGDEDDRLRAA